MKGIIATDIDRTLTNLDHEIPKKVIDYLRKSHLEGFEIVFLTGRTFSFSKNVLKECDFPFHLAVQNGAEVFKMPEQVHLVEKLLTMDQVRKIRALRDGMDRDFVLYASSRLDNTCYYDPSNFLGEAKDHIEYLVSLKKVPWKSVQCFESLGLNQFSLMRMNGTQDQLALIKDKIDALDCASSVILNDVVKDGSHLMMVAEKGVNKGDTLKDLKKKNGWSCKSIGCGDDLNDYSLLADAADIAIGMENGHPELLKKAHILAKPSYELGIIAALEKAKELL